MAIAFVNSAEGHDYTGAAGGSIAAAALNVTTGNLLVASIRGNDSSATGVSSLTDTASNTWTRATSILSNDGIVGHELWYCKNATGNASNVVTANFSGVPTYRGIVVAQYSGVDTSAPLDATATGKTSGASTVSSGSLSTVQADEVLIAAGTYENTFSLTWTADTGFTIDIQDSQTALMLSRKIVSSTQSGITITNTISTSEPQSIVVATFKAAGGGGGPTYPQLEKLPRGLSRGILLGGRF
jgi:hypothetical protein